MFNLFAKKETPIQLWFDTDIHCHVLPGIDDGSQDADKSVSLIKEMAGLGIRRIIASPHVAAYEFPNTPETLEASYAELKNALANSGVDMDVSHSAEYRIDDGFREVLDDGKIIPYPGNYVLIENSWMQEPFDLDSIIFDLQVRGYNPILAHPERFTYYHNRPARYDELHGKVPFQVNILSLAGYYGKTEKAVAERLLKQGYADFLGTDIHGMRHVECIRHYLATKDAARHREMSLPTLQNDKIFPAN